MNKIITFKTDRNRKESKTENESIFIKELSGLILESGYKAEYELMIDGLSPIPIVRMITLVDKMYELYRDLSKETDTNRFFGTYDRIEYLYAAYTESLNRYKALNKSSLPHITIEFDHHLSLHDGFPLLEKAVKKFHDNYPDVTEKNRIAILSADEDLEIFRGYVFRTFMDLTVKDSQM